MGQKAVIADIHADAAEDVLPNAARTTPVQLKNKVSKQKRNKMDEDDWRGIAPLDAPRATDVNVEREPTRQWGSYRAGSAYRWLLRRSPLWQ